MEETPKNPAEAWVSKILQGLVVPIIAVSIGMYVSISRLEDHSALYDKKVEMLEQNLAKHAAAEAKLWAQLAEKNTEQLVAFARLESLTNQIKDKLDEDDSSYDHVRIQRNSGGRGSSSNGRGRPSKED